MRASSHVVRVIDLKTQHIGPEELLVAGKLQFDPALTSPEVSDAIDEIETALRAAIPLSMRIYIEPDTYDSDHPESTDRKARG